MSWQSLVKLKAWEINVGLLGLALSLTTALMVAQGLKNFGKPRPNMLARCDPDLSRLQDYVVGGYGTGELNRWVIVDVKICRQTDQKILNDGFQSFPSGHCTSEYSTCLEFDSLTHSHSYHGRSFLFHPLAMLSLRNLAAYIFSPARHIRAFSRRTST